MSNLRSAQKEKTRRKIIDAAFNQLTAEKSFSNLSLREVTREANIAPTSLYVHFKDMNDLGLTMVDEAGLILRQLFRHARLQIEKTGESSTITSLNTFFEFINEKPNIFRLLLREICGTSGSFRTAVLREMQHFIDELTEYIVYANNGITKEAAYLQADAMVTLVFAAGAQALDMNKSEQNKLKHKLINQILLIRRGSRALEKTNI